MYWWHGDRTENLYMEVTGRDDIGADLKAPLLARGGKPTGAYALVPEVKPGDIVLHYFTKDEAIIGISVASDAAEPAPIFWAARGSYARAAGERPRWLSGIRVPLTEYSELDPVIPLDEIRQHGPEILLLREALQSEHGGSLYFPWIPYGNGPLRTFQTYLAKVPRSVLPLLPDLKAAVEAFDTVPPPLSDDGADHREVADLAGRAGTVGVKGSGLIRP